MRKNIPISNNAEQLKQSQLNFALPIDYEQLDALTHKQYSHNSLLSMLNDWNRFSHFCRTKHVSPLPASITAIRLFLEKESQQRKYATLRRYSLTIGLIHRLHALSDPTNHRQIHFTLAQLRQIKKGDATQATAFTRQHLSQLTQKLEHSDSIKDLRDLIIYHLMFECALKRGQLRAVELEHLIVSGYPTIQLMVNDHQYSLTPALTQLLHKWLSFIPSHHTYLLSRIDKYENLGDTQLDDSSIYRVFRRASELLRLPKHLQFSGQSSRIGATKDLYAQGYNLKQIQDFGRWMSPVMPAQYLEKYQLSDSEQMKFRQIKSWD
ncbi:MULTISPECIES: site-specific integrase [Vibrio]|uniref:Tyrosine-type recombinase/integrase n=1 Tax=Vibrio algicola TaxID=2662262 RepID=A0A5Q0TJG2_9VIBR|nr:MULTISPECIES: tyrosine-type recombinase/integrase [Vibrio]MBD1576600.1 tyrosine-type recombinase/integrase [Vibrio sp. S11_S32]